MGRVTVQILGEGFLHPAARLEAELTDEHGLLHLPVDALQSDVQFFRCRARSDDPQASGEWILADAAHPGDRDLARRVLAARFAGSAFLFLRSQADGRAAVDCLPHGSLTVAGAASVAVVMYAAAWDESETITVEGCGARHAFQVDGNETGHWAELVAAPDPVARS